MTQTYLFDISRTMPGYTPLTSRIHPIYFPGTWHSECPPAVRTDARRGPGERHQEVPMRFRRRPGVAPMGPSRATTTALAAVAAATLIAACSSGGSSSPGAGTTPGSSAAAAGETTIGVDLTYNSTAFWA